MAARDRGSMNLRCPGCGAEGSMSYSENDYPFMKRLDFTVDEISGPFRVGGKVESFSTTDVWCNSCDTKVK